MGVLLSNLRAALPEGMSLPEPIVKLYEWIETRGSFSKDGAYGSLTPRMVEAGTEIGFHIEPHSSTYYRAWFGSSHPEIPTRLLIIANTGGEGSRAGLWRNDAGETKVVHLGSGSGSTMVCQLGEQPVDFLRLLAMGYEELCWDEHFSEPPRFEREKVDDEDEEEELEPRRPHVEFQDWVRDTFGVTIPATAAEIVRVCKMRDFSGGKIPHDPFARWVASVRG